MNIEGLGQYNLQSGVKASREASREAGFEDALRKAYDAGDKEKLREACIEFESIMLKTLYQKMKATVPKSDLLEESSARTIFQDMLDEELMNAGSRRGIGIADMMYRQLSAQMDRMYRAAPEEEKEADSGEMSSDQPNEVEAVEE
jgi:flagellar protein FlgJ